ncbi:glycosyltransferase family 4 protein [Winogradskyella psychrotolerans]|uniref:glycosyltransferase family 4 protein n=1 Tax=Winogradskyella psychrotolerans TaxID=1344585 RepID=UPI001C071A04|nr:glycosyltransferase family 4 protein [Winogradskyella psychrotolerans]MBU2920901.1 glycosyltransferase family 4 protein [Winogradskyella psychrotolerans]
MKILFFTNEYSHPELPANGGVGTFFKTISKELVDKGHQVHIYGFSKKKYDLNDGNIKIKFFKQYSKTKPLSELMRSLSSSLNQPSVTEYWLKKERLFLMKKLKSYALKNNIDIIQSFTFNGFTAYWDNSIPLVTRFHGSRGFWHYYLGKKNETLKIKMEKKALLATPYSVANSSFSKKFIKNYYDVDVDAVIPNGIDTNHFSPKNVVNIPKSLFYIGTLSEAKGVKDLAKIFNAIIKEEPNATLHLIGRGEKYWEYLKAEVFSEQALKNTTYHSHITFSKIPIKLSEASIIAVPSKGETFGFTIIEAMALEKVTIVSNIPVAKEIINHGKDGFIAKNNDDFKNLVLEVFKNPQDYKTLEKQARQKVLSLYTKEKMTADTLSYYNEILSKKN